MAATPQILLIPFKGGLDTCSNAHLLQPGFLTLSMGTMLDRPGTAYPGPGFNVTQWAVSTGQTWQNHGIAGLNHGPTTNDDQLLFWSTLPGGSGPGVSVAGTSTTSPTQQRLAPWRQATQRVIGDSQTYLASTFGSMSGPPQVAVCDDIAMYLWKSTSGGYVQMMTQNLDTHAWAGPYTLNTVYGWVGGTPLAVDKVAVAGDGTYFRLNVLIGTAWTYAAYPASAPTTQPNLPSAVAGTYNNIDATGTGDEGASGYAVLVAYDSGNHKLRGISCPSDGTTGSPVDLITSLNTADTRPITCSPVRSTTTSTGFLFAGMDGSEQVKIVSSGLTLGSLVTTTVTATAYSNNPRALSVANTVSGSAGAVAIAAEQLSTVNNWNQVFLTSVVLAAPSVAVTTSTLTGWGGCALLGKFYSWYNGAEFRPLLAVRTGWWDVTGAWGTLTVAGTGTFAYPNGYLYDYTGQLYARFGDADVGTNALWPAFDAGGYVGSSLQPLPSGLSFTLDSGQRTLIYAWPQMGYVDFVSARTADSGSPIGARCGLSTVTWLAPTASEPPAAAVQFGGELVIPGTITAIFDGSNLFESGFFLRAPTPRVTSNGGGGSLPNATTYLFQTVLVYADAAGRTHYSAPSLRVSCTTTAVNDKFNFTQYGLMSQTLHPSTAPIAMQIYRSAGNPTGNNIQMYLVSTLHLISGLSQTGSDGTTDANLDQGPVLYTLNAGTNAGAATGTDAPPPFDSLTVWNNQVWGIANRNGPELWCTWPLDDSVLAPEGPTWSNANTVAIPAEVGQPKAIIGLDEKLIVLGTRADYGLVGQAPVRTSSLVDSPSFSAPILIPTPGGCKVLNGAVRLPKGILFQGTQGFMLLGRDLAYTAVGNPVKNFARSNLYLPGVLFPEQQAVLLCSSADTTQNLIYFYDTDEWAQAEQPPADTLNTAAAAVLVGSVRAVVGGVSKVYALPSTQPYYCEITPFSKYMKFRTPWIELADRSYGKPASVTGYGMLREVQVLGTLPEGFPGNQTLTMYTEYDYPGNTVQLPETQSLTLTAGTQADLEYQWRFGFSQGNAKRVRFTVTIDGGVRTASSAADPTVLLTGLMLSYDVDTGLSRMGAANSTGT